MSSGGMYHCQRIPKAVQIIIVLYIEHTGRLGQLVIFVSEFQHSHSQCVHK